MRETIEVHGQPVAIEAYEQPIGCRVEITPLTDVTDAFKDQVFLAASQWSTSHWPAEKVTCTRVNGIILLESTDAGMRWSQSATDDIKTWLQRPMTMSAVATGVTLNAGDEDLELASS